MKITFKNATVEDCKLIISWIKSNEFARHWYYLDKTPRLSTLERKMEKKLKYPNVKSTDFVKRYFADITSLIASIVEYRRVSNVPSGEYTLSDLLK